MAADQALGRWLSEQLGFQDAYVARELGGGNSNVTLLVESGSGRAVLRRPPHNSISPLAARGVRREFDVLKALDGAVPAPRALAFCDDPAVIGAPFAVFSHLPGVAITDTLPDGYADGEQALERMGDELAHALGTLHGLDWEGLALPGMARPDGFLARQLERWTKIRAADSVRDLPLLDTVASALARRLPEESPSALLHGDYHLDNTLFHTDRPALSGIIDWELAAVGDPRLDLGLLLAFWGQRPMAAPGFAFVQAVTRSGSCPPREHLAARWSEASGLDPGDLAYFVAFALWRLAAMVEGAYVLQRRGRVDSDYARSLEHTVPALLAEAAVHLGLHPA